MLGPAKSRRLDEPIAVWLEALVPADRFYCHLEAEAQANTLLIGLPNNRLTHQLGLSV